MTEHSIKVPRLYKNASKIAKEVSDGKGSIKQLVYESKHRNIKALYALVVHVFQKMDEIEQLFRKSKLLIKEPRLDPWLAKILITELLWGKKRLPGDSKPIKTVLAYEQILKAHLSDVSPDSEDFKQVEKPRYVRINTLKMNVNEAVENFRNEGWVLKRYTDTQNYLGFLGAVANLNPEEFMIDLHIPYLLVFPPKTQFYQHPAYKNGSIILQDKASCLPVHILNPEPGSTVLDMCAAPGMKTSHCAAILENQGKIFAVELSNKRFEILKRIIETSGATCVEAINRDVLTLTQENCPNVDYILVDPSCSGSGITDRVEIGQQKQEQCQDRLQKLSGFQIKMLRYALTRFPKAKRVVYSTCSVYPEENEDVVRQVLETSRYFKLVPAGEFVQDRWQNFGSLDFGDIGNFCLYAKPDIDLTSGFFVAVFQRLEEGESNQFLNRRLASFGKERRKEPPEMEFAKKKIKVESENAEIETKGNEKNDCDYVAEVEDGILKRTKINNEDLVGENALEKIKNLNDQVKCIKLEIENADSAEMETVVKKKKKKKKKVKDENSENGTKDTFDCENIKKKKSKKNEGEETKMATETVDYYQRRRAKINSEDSKEEIRKETKYTKRKTIVEELEIETSQKKKKKKKKKSETDDGNTENETNLVYSNDGNEKKEDGTSLKKKKKIKDENIKTD